MDVQLNESLIRSLLKLNQMEKEESQKTIQELEHKIDLLERQLQQFQKFHMARMRHQSLNARKYYQEQSEKGYDTVDESASTLDQSEEEEDSCDCHLSNI